MTNIILASLLSLVSSYAQAYPTLGDRVMYNLSYNQDGSVLTGTLDQSVVDFDPVASMYYTEAIVVVNGEVVSQERSEVKVDEMFSHETFELVYNFCENVGGTREVVIVPAGTFDTCVIRTEDGRSQTQEVWIGDLPFGIVKANAYDSNNVFNQIEAVSVQSGQ